MTIPDLPVTKSLPTAMQAVVFGGQAKVKVCKIEMNFRRCFAPVTDTGDPKKDVGPT